MEEKCQKIMKNIYSLIENKQFSIDPVLGDQDPRGHDLQDQILWNQR